MGVHHLKPMGLRFKAYTQWPLRPPCANTLWASAQVCWHLGPKGLWHAHYFGMAPQFHVVAHMHKGHGVSTMPHGPQIP